MATERLAASDLGPQEIRMIAGAAGGLRPETVEDYFAGQRKQHHETIVAIEGALRDLGWATIIRPRPLAKTSR
jgi:hypothetical protein